MAARIRRFHSALYRSATRLSTAEFLRIDAWALWFYLVCCLAFLLASLADLNGSSISAYSSIYGHGAEQIPLLGQARAIRSDEYTYATPAILNQSLRVKRFRTSTSSLGNHSVSLFSNVPIAHVTALFRPQFWSFFFLPVDYAFAVYWQFKALILLTGVFTWLLLITRSTFWSVTGSLWFYFSPSTQWSYSWPSGLPEMIGCVCFGCVAACYLVIGKNRVALGIAAVVLPMCTVNAAMCAYLPHLLPIAYVGFLSFLAWCIGSASVIRRQRSKAQLIAAVGALLLVAIPGTVLLQQGSYAMKVISDTTYPGHRIFPGASVVLSSYMAHFLNWSESEAHFAPNQGNICEGAGYFWVAPAVLACLGRLTLSRTQKAFTLALFVVFFGLLSWSLLPVPSWIVKILLLNRTGSSRLFPALGLANVAIVCLAASCIRARSANVDNSLADLAGKTSALFLLMLIVFALADWTYAWFFTRAEVFATAVVVTLTATFLMEGYGHLLAAFLVLPSIYFFAGVNPIQRGLPTITSSQTYRFLHSNGEYLGKRWIVFSEGQAAPGFLTAIGCDVYTGEHYLPDVDHFQLFASRHLDPTLYNRAGYTLAGAIALNKLTYLDPVAAPIQVNWRVSPEDPILRQLGIRFAAFETKPPAEMVRQLTPLLDHPIDNFWLYRLPN